MKNVLFTLCCLMLLEEAKATTKQQKVKNGQDEEGEITWCSESDEDCDIN
jgi:hypothetical protein